MLAPVAICLAPQITPAQSAGPSTSSYDRLIEEVRSLRIELLESRLERRVQISRELERAMDTTRSLRLQLDAETQAQQEELKRLREDLQRSEFNPVERAQIEASKTDAVAAAGERTRRERLAAEQRDAATREQLDREKEQIRKLNEVLAALRRSP
jgi:hypothetical protein